MTGILPGALSRKAVAATLAAALTLTSASTAPARADGNGDAIAAAAFFGLVAAAIIATTKDSAAHPPYSPHPQRAAPRKLLPAQCRFEIGRGPDRDSWYNRRCLVANYTYWQLLPHRCERWVDFPRRQFNGIAYSATCLSRVGYVHDEGGRGVHH